jgi:membrane associated rhomboid family serine protease
VQLSRSVTLVIVALTALSWLITTAINANNSAALGLGVIPARLSGLPGVMPAVPAWLTPLSATLVHGGFLHLAFNLLMLGWCGLAVERVLGRGALLLLYVVGAYAAAIAQWAVAPLSMIPMIGASGAISAVIGAYALSLGQQKRIVRSAALNRWLNAAWLLATWVVLQFLVGWAAGGQGVMLATPAHIGGFLAGLALQRPLLLWRYRDA